MSKFFYIPSDALLYIIQDMIDEYKLAMKTNGANSDYLSGGEVALRELAVRLNLCSFEDLLD